MIAVKAVVSLCSHLTREIGEVEPSEYEIPDDNKVLVATPNYTNLFSSEVHTNHVECGEVWGRGGIDYNWTIVGRSFVHFARTRLCQLAVSGGFTHLFWLDDDAIIDPMILPKFLAHDKDVVIAPYPMRKMPHAIGILSSTCGDFRDHDSYKNMEVKDLNQGLIQVDGGGTHCMLVKTATFLKKGPVADCLSEDEEPEELTFQEEDDKGLHYFIMPKSGTEDMLWCYRAKCKDIEVWCDTDVFANHVGFSPVITREWCDYVADSEEMKDMDWENSKLRIIPGSENYRNLEGGVRADRAANLV